jgi:hypothetical protein
LEPLHAGPEPQVHVPASQKVVRLPLHAWHARPGFAQVLMPHVSQTLPLQHPLGHDVASHTQFPPEQRWPAPHTPWVPQAQVPVVGSHVLVNAELVQS